MKQYLFLLSFLLTSGLLAQNQIYSLVTITNNPAINETLDVNSDVRTWKSTITDETTQIARGATIGASFTNLILHLRKYPIDNISPLPLPLSTNAIRFFARAGDAHAVTITTNWASRTYVTNVVKALDNDHKVVADLAAMQALDPALYKSVTIRYYENLGDGGGGTFYSTNDSLTDDGGTIIASSHTSGYYWVRVYSGPVLPEWWGARGNGSVDDTAAFNEALSNFKMLQLLPGKHYRINVTIGSAGTIIQGTSSSQASPSTKISPYDNTLPALTIGDDSARTYGTKISDVTFWGANTYTNGVRLAGGAYQVVFDNCYWDKFIGKAIHSEGETNQPTALIRFENCYVQRGTNSIGSTIYIKNKNGANNWTTSISFSGCHLITSGTSGRMIEIEDCELIWVNNSYMDLGGSGVSVLMDKVGSSFPRIFGDGTGIIESTAGTTAVEFTGFDPSTSLATYISNTQVTGNIVTTSGTKTFTTRLLPQYTHLRYPLLSEPRFFDINTHITSAAEVATTAKMYKAGAGLYIDHNDASTGGEIILRPKVSNRLKLSGVPTITGDTGANGFMEFWSTSGAASIAKVQHTEATPEGTIAGQPGGLTMADESGVGKLYLKKKNTNGTGWVEISPGGAVQSNISSTAIDWDLGVVHYKVLSGNVTFTFSNNSDGETVKILLDGDAGSYTVTWPAGIEWPGGTAHTMTATGKDFIELTQINGVVYGRFWSNLN